MERKIYVAYGAQPSPMTQLLLEGAEVNARIPQGASIALKPNLVVAKSPESGATTHGEILEAIVAYLRDHGRKDICIMEGAWVGDSTKRGFSACGYDKIAKRYDLPLIDLKSDRTKAVDTPVGPIQICERALNTDYIINLPVLKGHCQTRFTCALKNCKGCIPDSEKRRFHTMGLHQPIAALAAALRPALTIVDSICGDLSFEEGGNPVSTGRMLLGEDMVQLDAFGCSLMGISLSSVPYIQLAQKYGAGDTRWEPEDILQVNQPQDQGSYPRPSGLTARLTKDVRQCDACSACFGNLVHALYRLDQEGRRKGLPPIHIGQGFQGKTLEGIGIGRCCSGAQTAVSGCPPPQKKFSRCLKPRCSL